MAKGKPILDVSFAGATVEMAGVTIEDFMDDANPVEFADVEVSSVGVNCNGNMIRNAKPNVIMMSVTVIPGSDADNKLYQKWKKYRVQGGGSQRNGQWAEALTGSVSVPGGPKRTFSNGTFVSGPPGPSSNGEGKMQGRTYTCAFVTAN